MPIAAVDRKQEITMTIQNIIDSFTDNRVLTDEQITSILSDLRNETVKQIRHIGNRAFSIALLNKIIAKRKDSDSEIGSTDNIMYACYLVGLCGHLEDSILIWQAKKTDFDTYCGVDIQLVVFAGVSKTVLYLKTLKTEESAEAVTYLQECWDAGDFDEIENYFLEEEEPYWL